MEPLRHEVLVQLLGVGVGAPLLHQVGQELGRSWESNLGSTASAGTEEEDHSGAALGSTVGQA